MAKTIDNINKVYDRVRFNITDSKDSCVVDESNPVKLRHLVIKSAGADFHCMKTDYVKDLKCMTEKRSSRLKDSNCDGIAFVDDCVDKEHLVFAELKSCEPDSKLDEALNQIIHSFFKCHGLFSLCDGYDIDNYTIDFVLACSSPRNYEEKEAEFLSVINSNDELGKADNDYRFSIDLLPYLFISETKSLKFRLKEMHCVSGLPLHKGILNKEIALHLALADCNTPDMAMLDLPF